MISLSIVLGAGIFGSVGMLAWAAAAVIPLLLHLWNRRQHNTAPWAAMDFLLAAVQEQAKRVRLEQILLLLLRMAILVVLATALADPMWQFLPSLGNSLGSRVPRHHLFIFDTSYSLDYRIADRTRLEQAKQIARDIISDCPQGDGFTIVAMSNPSKPIVSLPAFSADDALSEITDLQLQHTGANLVSALNLAHSMLATVQSNFPRLQKHRIYLLSDMGQTTWAAANGQPVRKKIAEIASTAEIVTIDVGAGVVSNRGITSVNRETAVVTPSNTTRWQVSIQEWGESNTNRSNSQPFIELWIDNNLVSKSSIEFGQGTTTSTIFEYRFDTLGEHTVEFRLSEDALSIDNHYYEVVNVWDRISTLCIEGRPGEARNVAVALAPTDDSNIDVRILPEHRLMDTHLEEYDAIFLCNVGRFTTERAAQLRDYLQLHRGIVMFLGDQASPENYNRILAETTEQPRISPARLIGIAPYATHQFAPSDYRHPIIAPFRGQERSGLVSTPIWNYMRLEIPTPSPELVTASAPQVVLDFANGDPAIVEHTVLGGRLTMFAFPASERSSTRESGQLRPWTAWNTWPSFLPLIQESLAFSLGGIDNSRNGSVGTPLTSTLPTASRSQYVTITHPKSAQRGSTGGRRRISIQEGDRLPYWIHGEVEYCGFYEASIPDVDRVQKFAVNLQDTRESQLERFPSTSLPSQFQRNSIQANEQAGPDIDFKATPLFRVLLGILLALLLTESYVAWYLGNARA